MAKFDLRINGSDDNIEVSRQGEILRITRNGRTAVLELVKQTGYSLIFDRVLEDGTRQRLRAAVHQDGDKRQVWLNGRIFAYERVRRAAAGRTDAGSGSLAASIPAVVTEILVQVGDSVNAGDKLILLESMKMVIPIQSPSRGIVMAIKCTAGDSVQAGVPLIEIDEQAGSEK